MKKQKIDFRVTPEEKQQLETEAARKGLTVSEYIREKLFGKLEIRRVPEKKIR